MDNYKMVLKAAVDAKFNAYMAERVCRLCIGKDDINEVDISDEEMRNKFKEQYKGQNQGELEVEILKKQRETCGMLLNTLASQKLKENAENIHGYQHFNNIQLTYYNLYLAERLAFYIKAGKSINSSFDSKFVAQKYFGIKWGEQYIAVAALGTGTGDYLQQTVEPLKQRIDRAREREQKYGSQFQ